MIYKSVIINSKNSLTLILCYGGGVAAVVVIFHIAVVAIDYGLYMRPFNSGVVMGNLTVMGDIQQWY